jgi:ribosome biogenesis protein MAK21
MQEVLTLGGDEDDLKLIQGVETDDEDAISEGGPNGQAVTADFRKELSSFAASLGIGGDGFQNEPQSEDESEEWDDASVQSEVAPPKAAPKAAPKEVQATSRQGIAAAPQQNGQNRLVSELVAGVYSIVADS